MTQKKTASSKKKIDEVEVFKKEAKEYSQPTPEIIEDNILDEDGNVIEDNFDEALDAIWKDIAKLEKNGRNCSGFVNSFEKDASGVPFCCVKYLGQRVIIPLSEMAMPLDSNVKDDRDVNKQLEALGNSMLGTEIDFVIIKHDREKQIILGSRKAAKVKKIKKNYDTLRSNGSPNIYPGRKVNARIIGIAPKSIRVEVMGVEAIMGINKITHLFIADIRDNFCIGKHIAVKIDSVTFPKLKEDEEKTDDWYMGVKIECHAKALDDEEPLTAFKRVREGAYYTGTVTGTSGDAFLVALDCGVNAFALDYFGFETPNISDKIVFYCDSKRNAERLIVEGKITRIIESKYL